MICTNPVNLPDVEEKIASKIVYLNPISYHSNPVLNRVLTYFVGPLRIPKAYDLFHVSDHMIGVFARFVHPSIVTAHGVFMCKAWSSADVYLPTTSRFGSFLSAVLSSPSIYNFFLDRSISSLRHAEGVICVSETEKRDVVKRLGMDPSEIEVIYEGVYHDVFKPRDTVSCRKELNLPLDKKIILHVGSEAPFKNVPFLIKAFYKLRKLMSDVILVRVGRKRVETSELIGKLGLTDIIYYFSNISDETLAKFYNAADLFVFPSFYEGFGFPPLEAMASGCPVIGGDCGAIREVVGNAGILINSFDIDNLSKMMERVLNDEDLRQKLRENSQKRAENFSWDKCAKETMKFYRKVLNKS